MTPIFVLPFLPSNTSEDNEAFVLPFMVTSTSIRSSRVTLPSATFIGTGAMTFVKNVPMPVVVFRTVGLVKAALGSRTVTMSAAIKGTGNASAILEQRIPIPRVEFKGKADASTTPLNDVVLFPETNFELNGDVNSQHVDARVQLPLTVIHWSSNSHAFLTERMSIQNATVSGIANIFIDLGKPTGTLKTSFHGTGYLTATINVLPGAMNTHTYYLSPVFPMTY